MSNVLGGERKTKLKMSDDINWDRLWFAVHGPAGSGKTKLLSTLSNDDPGELLDTVTDLNDIIVISLDGTGHIALSDTNVRAPVLSFDDYLVQMDLETGDVHEPGAYEAAKEMLLDAKHVVIEKGLRVVTFDPVSELNKALLAEIHEEIENMNGKKNDFLPWKMLGYRWAQIINILRSIPANICLGFHSADKMSTGKGAERNKKLASLVDAATGIELDMTGTEAKNTLRGRCRFIGSIHKTALGGREIYFSDNDIFEGKSSFENKLENWREPNLKKMVAFLQEQIKGESK